MDCPFFLKGVIALHYVDQLRPQTDEKGDLPSEYPDLLKYFSPFSRPVAFLKKKEIR